MPGSSSSLRPAPCPLHSVALATLMVMGASSATAAQWTIIPVQSDDTVSSLFDSHGLHQRTLMNLAESKTVAKRLAAVRAGDTLELLTGDMEPQDTERNGRHLKAVRIHSSDGKVMEVRRVGEGRWRHRNKQLAQRARQALTVRRLEAMWHTATAPIQISSQITSQTHSTLSAFNPTTKLMAMSAKGDVTANMPVNRANPTADTTANMVIEPLEQYPSNDGYTSTVPQTITLAKNALERLVPSSSLRLKPQTLDAAVRAAEAVIHQHVMTARKSRAATARSGSTIAALVHRAEQNRWSISARGTRTRTIVTKAKGGSQQLSDPRIATVVAAAKEHIGVPYLWGGATPKGFDCSGFVSYHLKRIGIHVPRTAAQQFRHTRVAAVSREDLRPGDLVFFWDRKRRNHIGHVGIYIGGNKFIHAVGENIPVTITPIDKRSYKHRFAGGGRVIS